MDNCMFQIETALLRFDGGNDIIDKTSVVKRYLCLVVDDLQLKFVPTQIILWQNPPTHHKRRWPTFSIVNTWKGRFVFPPPCQCCEWWHWHLRWVERLFWWCRRIPGPESQDGGDFGWPTSNSTSTTSGEIQSRFRWCNLLVHYRRECNSTARPYSHINLKPMSNSGKIFTWIASWIMQIRPKRPSPRQFRLSSMLPERDCDYW